MTVDVCCNGENRIKGHRGWGKERCCGGLEMNLELVVRMI